MGNAVPSREDPSHAGSLKTEENSYSRRKSSPEWNTSVVGAMTLMMDVLQDVAAQVLAFIKAKSVSGQNMYVHCIAPFLLDRKTTDIGFQGPGWRVWNAVVVASVLAHRSDTVLWALKSYRIVCTSLVTRSVYSPHVWQKVKVV